ncbi:MAG: beta-glucosidase family protein [Acidimicrobiales bacterium]
MTSPPLTIPEASAPYRDPARPVDERVADLLTRMTPEEKVSQLGSLWIFQVADEADLDEAKADELLHVGLGQITRLSGASNVGPAAAASLANQIQRRLVERTRLGIPAVIHEEICSGFMGAGAVTHPQALGVAATFRPDNNRAIADHIRTQMRARGAHQGLSPVLDVCRDPRWGRLEETYGEDPVLVAKMGAAFVEGLQGATLADGVVATAKHFVGYGASEGGMNWAPAHLPARELRDVYLRPFEVAVRTAGLGSVMNSYGELDGVPCGASSWLLDEVLRREWGFEGTVVADYFSIRQLETYHRVVPDQRAAAVRALTAGIDVELPGVDCYGPPLLEALERGEIDMALVDRSVARVLAQKFALGLFEQPFVDEGSALSTSRTRSELATARLVADESLVLLVNDGTLPLAPSGAHAPRRVAVIGPNAASARNLLGDYSYLSHVESLTEVLTSGDNVFSIPLDDGVSIDPQGDLLAGIPTVLDALRDRLAESEVVHAPGCAVLGDDRSGFDDAVAAAAGADVAIVVVGDKAGLTDDCSSGESRDVASLDLPGVQEELVQAVAATGTPLVVVLVAGRPIGSPAMHDAATAVLHAWLPGERGGDAVADALVGRTCPAGRLPVSYPRSVGQVPIFYGHKISGGRSHWKGSYVDESNEPLYPFGHGLSYTTFGLEVTEPANGPVGFDDVVRVRVRVTNTGDVTGDEVVQLYRRQPAASVTRPVLEFVDACRVGLHPGTVGDVVFEVPVASFAFSGIDGEVVVEAGTMELFVGPSSVVLEPAGVLDVAVERPVPADLAVLASSHIESAHADPAH